MSAITDTRAGLPEPNGHAPEAKQVTDNAAAHPAAEPSSREHSQPAALAALHAVVQLAGFLTDPQTSEKDIVPRMVSLLQAVHQQPSDGTSSASAAAWQSSFTDVLKELHRYACMAAL